MKKIVVFLATLLVSTVLFSRDTIHTQPILAFRSDYIEFENRKIKALSKGDIDELLEGKGWGLALAAELNGYPGPVHLLEMTEAGKLDLNTTQFAEIKKLHNEMRSKVIPLGKKYVMSEQALNDSFAKNDIDDVKLRQLVSETYKYLSELKYTHLSYHLKTVKILSKTQNNEYNRLRGYGATDPCSFVPKGHSPSMWKKHNNCK